MAKFPETLSPFSTSFVTKAPKVIHAFSPILFELLITAPGEILAPFSTIVLPLTMEFAKIVTSSSILRL